MSIPEEFASLNWVRAEAVADAISNGAQLTVIDVRNAEVRDASLCVCDPTCVQACLSLLQEFATGHIKGALNVESTAFADGGELDRVVDTVKAASGQVVMHCQLCQKVSGHDLLFSGGPMACTHGMLQMRSSPPMAYDIDAVAVHCGMNNFQTWPFSPMPP